jgi:tripartite-type tricarboxylate transporter receptor subunit TctC
MSRKIRSVSASLWIAPLADPALKMRLADLGVTVFSSSPSDFGRLIADETDKWAKVIKFAGIKAE